MTDSKTDRHLVNSERRRGRILTILLVLFVILTSLTTIFNLTMGHHIAANLSNAPFWAAGGIFAIGLLGILMVVGLMAIWKWYRWGAYLFAVAVAAVFGLNMLILGGGTPFLGLVGGGVILFLVSRQWSEFV